MDLYEESLQRLHDLILNTREPIVLRNLQQPRWDCFSRTLKEWCKVYDDESTGGPARFERMSRKCAQNPQWERKRHEIRMSTKRFLEEHSEEQDFWTGLNYVRVRDISAPKCVEGVDFSRFGFPHAAQDATLWLSSKGANTPTHYDTYGCNIVCQQYGRKSWLLFPPSAPLTSIRVPYEESSVYCSENFYAPQPENIASLVQRFYGTAHRCVLAAGDVLIVPRRWWHFVEALELSLTVNSWLPLALDGEAQLEECIVKYIVEKAMRDSSTELLKYVFNPNQLNEISEEADIFGVMRHLREKLSLKERTDYNVRYQYEYLQEYEVKALLKSVPQAEEIPLMSRIELSEYLQQNSERFDEHCEQADASEVRLDKAKEILLNSMTKSEIVADIRKEFCKRF